MLRVEIVPTTETVALADGSVVVLARIAWRVAEGASMGNVHMISSAIRYRSCPCGVTVLAALSEGVPVSVDPAVVDSHTELVALMQGRHSYDLVRIGNRTELVYRSIPRMRNRNHPVVIEHPCRIVDVGDPQQWRKKQSPPLGKSPPISTTPIQPPF